MATDSLCSLVNDLGQCRLLEPAQLEELTRSLQARFPDPKALARELLRRGWLTPYQANQLLQGKGQELVLGSYILLERLGEGGMGQVFKARHRNLGRIVALKLIRKERLDNPAIVKRFQREVRAAAALSHANIVLAYDADEVNGTQILVMECVEGGTDLGRLLQKRGPLPVAQACDYVRQAALGLQHAHERGLVHRDIKPGNLLVTADGKTVKVLDMGLARLEHRGEASATSSTMTQEGAVMGTANYMAPEQARDSHHADIRADLYSLGCTLYYLLTGRVPFPTGSMAEKLLKHQFHEPPPLERLRPDVPPGVVAVVRKLMAKQPEHRYQTPAEAATALAVSAGTGFQSVPPEHGDDRTVGMEGRGEASLSEDTVESAFSYMAHGGDTEALAPPRPAQQARQRRWLWIGMAAGTCLLGGVVLALLLFKWLGNKKPPVEEEEHPVAVVASTKKPLPVDDDWLKKVVAMPPEKQVEAVVAKLKELNSGFDGKVMHKIGNKAVTELQFLPDNVADLSPVRALKGLKTLVCQGSAPGKGKVADLGPLKDLKLTWLDCAHTLVADLSPLKGMPLTYLNCGSTRVTDLSPLKDMKLTSLLCYDLKVADLSPLKAMPLTRLECRSTKVTDLTPLKDTKLEGLDCRVTQISDLTPLKNLRLKHLFCSATRVSDLSPLKGMPLTILWCDDTRVSDLSPLKGMKLTELRCGFTKVSDLSPLKGMPLGDLRCDDTKVADLSPLKDMPLTHLDCGHTPVAALSPLEGMKLEFLNCAATKVGDLTPLKRMPLRVLYCSSTRVTDLSPLRGMPLKVLSCVRTAVADLSPLKGMELNHLTCSETKVSDLSPLKGMPLQDLQCFGTQVSDLSPLKEMPLTTLWIDQTKVSDLSVLQGMPLVDLHCDKPERHAKILRSIKTLKKINDKPAKEFWMEVDGKKVDKK
jgi:serine/threonine protein kinase/Leucine-rich repeat (LRR) protein